MNQGSRYCAEFLTYAHCRTAVGVVSCWNGLGGDRLLAIATTEVITMDTEAMTTLEPKILGFWVRCLRETSRWSQDALAESSGLTVRTIQRIEAGNAASITTRRLLARGLGYDDQDIFEKPEFIETVHQLLKNIKNVQNEELEKTLPDHMRVACDRVSHGENLWRLCETVGAFVFNHDLGISTEAKDLAASLFDCLRDFMDIHDDVGFSDKAGFNKELESIIRDLEAKGTMIYYATRSTKITGANWADKTPLSLTIGYVTVVPAEKVLTEMWVPRRVS